MCKERTTMPRHWALLKALPTYPKKISIRQLWIEMEDLGYEVTKRTIERDLVNLSIQFPIVSDDAKPAGWSIRSNPSANSNTIDRLLPSIRPYNHPLSQKTENAALEVQVKIDPAELEVLYKRMGPPDPFTQRIKPPSDFIGRNWLLKRIDDWLTKRTSSLLWLHGTPGIGKTAFMSWFAQQRKDLVVGSFYCQYKFQKKSETIAHEAILSLALQLGQREPAYLKQIISHERLDRTALENHTAEELFSFLLVEPMVQIDNSMAANGRAKQFILTLDGLDEAHPNGSRNVLLDIITRNALVLPACLAIVISSRIEEKFVPQMAGIDTIAITADCEENHQDICQWLERYTPSNLKEQQSQLITETVIRQSEGLFLYLRLLKQDFGRFLENPELTPTGLDNFFSASFNRFFPDIETYSADQRPLLELLVSALEPVSQQTLCAALDWDTYRYDKVMASFGALLINVPFEQECSGSNEEAFNQSLKLTPFHKTLIDWLTSPSRAELYRVSCQQGQKRWSESLWLLYQTNLSRLHFYGVRFLPQHLIFEGRFNEARACLLDINFILRRTGFAVIYNDIYTVIQEYRQVHALIPIDDALLAWALFFRANGHYLKKGHSQWPADRILLQRAVEQPITSPVRQAADHFVEQKHHGYWLRSSMVDRDMACHVLDDQYSGIAPLIMNNELVVGIDVSGDIIVWNVCDGIRLHTLRTHTKAKGILQLDRTHVVAWTEGCAPSLNVWDISQGDCLVTVANRGNIQQVFKLETEQFVASFEDCSMEIWDFSGKSCSSIDQQNHVVVNAWPLNNSYFLTESKDSNNERGAKNIVSLWHGATGTLISQLNHFEASGSIEVKSLPGGSFLTYSHDCERFQIWDSEDGRLLATGNKQANRPLRVLNKTPVRILVTHDVAELTPWNGLLNVRTWLWDGKCLVFEKNVNLIADDSMKLDFSDQAACASDSQLFDDGCLLLPSPLSLWSSQTGDKIADLTGSWSLGIGMSDFGNFYRRFDDGRLLTWTEQNWSTNSLATQFYLWSEEGSLIRQEAISSLFYDLRLLNQNFFVTFNCDDTLQVWDAKTGELRQTIPGMGGKISSVQLLANAQLLTYDSSNNLTVWQLASQPILDNSHHHSSNAKINALLLNDRILSYSKDNFPPKLWDSHTGKFVANLKAYDSAVGASLSGVIPLSRDRFLTWGNAPALYVYDSEQGHCLATLEDNEKPHLGRSQAWSLQIDQILCHQWDNSLRIYDLQANHFNAYQILAEQVQGAFPISLNLVLYWCKKGNLRLWNGQKTNESVDLLGQLTDIKSVHSIRLHWVGIISGNRKPLLLNWKTGVSTELNWSHRHSATSITTLDENKIVVWCSDYLQLWDIHALPCLQFSTTFEKRDHLVFVAQLPDGRLLTQIINNRATLWTILDSETGNLVGSTLMSLEIGVCTEATTVDQTVFISITHLHSRNDSHAILNWQDPENLEYLPLNTIKNPDDLFALQKWIQQRSTSHGNWYAWSHLSGSPIGISKLGETDIHCEWHGAAVNQLLGLTNKGRLIGFCREPIILQLYNGRQSVTFAG